MNQDIPNDPIHHRKPELSTTNPLDKWTLQFAETWFKWLRWITAIAGLQYFADMAWTSTGYWTFWYLGKISWVFFYVDFTTEIERIFLDRFFNPPYRRIVPWLVAFICIGVTIAGLKVADMLVEIAKEIR